MAEQPERRRSRWLAPTFVFASLALLVVAQILTAPNDQALEERPSLDPRSALPNGSRGFYEVLSTLGWPMARLTAPMRAALDSTALHVVLEGKAPVTAAEVHQLLEAVRRGGRLLVTPTAGSAIADSLGMEASEITFLGEPAGPGGLRSSRLDDEDEEENDEDEAERRYIGAIDQAPPKLASSMDSSDIDELTTAAQRLRYVRAFLQPLDSSDTGRRPFPRDTVSFVTVYRRDGVVPVILGFEFGRGRVVAVADPFLFTNRSVRDGHAAVLLVRAVEWLAPSRDTRIVFDQYHHSRPTAEGAGPVRRAMLETPLGRATIQLLLAATLVVLALGARPLAPKPRLRLERRSPFEHVGALARAYEQVSATRIASRRLLHGLRRRHPIGRHTGDEESYLGALAARHPDVAAEIDTVRNALQRPLEPEQFLAVGQAIETIERKIQA
ncbi:MAG TPA: DUF4350 domain-containing protein [Gemmatimonadaceae bacterium]|nr:DUF4350 domain-containing protein [Gemmatimonadaceae bacterium]